MQVTHHAKDRIKERCGLPKKAIERNAVHALQNGVRHEECTGKLKKYVDWVFLSHQRGANIRLYSNHVYIFTSSEKLITVLPIPHIYKNTINKIIRNRNENASE